MKWFITGGCGFIGRNLTQELISEGDNDVRVYDNLSVGSRESLGRVCDFSEPNMSEMGSDLTGVQLVTGDILDREKLSESMQGMDVVVHLAANTGVEKSVQDPFLDCDTNVRGTLNGLDAALKNRIQAFVLASSNASVGECEPPLREDLPIRSVSPYGASKAAGEAYCSAYYRCFGLKTTALRFGNVYGPLSEGKTSVVAKFIKQVLREENLEVYGDGSQTRDFIHVKDIARAIVLGARSADSGGEIFQIATFCETTVNEIAERIIHLAKEKAGKSVDVLYGDERQGDVKKNYSDVSRARNVLGFEPLYDVQSGLEQTFDFFVQENGRHA